MPEDKNINTMIKISYKDSTIGPGIIKIMQLVKETESLSEAYRLMGLSSSKGWRIIKATEEKFGFPLFQSSVGGKGGGFTRLTEEGQDFLNKYEAFLEDLNLEAQKLYKKHFG